MPKRLYLALLACGLATPIGVAAQSADSMISLSGVKSLRVVSRTTENTGYSAEELRNGSEVILGGTMPLYYYMLIDPYKYGLPRPRDGWVYFQAGYDVYRVDISSREVLERVTDQMSAN